jgi:hypothetical protein
VQLLQEFVIGAERAITARVCDRSGARNLCTVHNLKTAFRGDAQTDSQQPITDELSTRALNKCF